MVFTALIFRKLALSTFIWSSPVLNFIQNGRKMQQKTAKISFAPINMTSTAMIYMTAVQRNTYTLHQISSKSVKKYGKYV